MTPRKVKSGHGYVGTPVLHWRIRSMGNPESSARLPDDCLCRGAELAGSVHRKPPQASLSIPGVP